MPAVAFALVLCALLTLAGAGSAAHGRWCRSGSSVVLVLLGIAVACALAGACLPLAIHALDGAL
ncbi:MAG: hypothetical protein AB1Z29_29250, partial [Desulfobacterales bacterium]